MRLVPLELRLPRADGPLRPQVEAALAAHGRALRWAITAVEGPAGQPAALLLIEAVIIAGESSSA